MPDEDNISWRNPDSDYTHPPVPQDGGHFTAKGSAVNLPRPLLALIAVVVVAQGVPSRADLLTIDPVNMMIDGKTQNVGTINASFS